MPIANRWWTFTDYVCNYEKDDSGVYELGATNDLVVYIGSSNLLRRRLKEHLAQPVTSCIKRNTKQYRVEYTTDCQHRERQLYDDFVRVNGHPPTCNSVPPA